ncbi:MAG: EAL domain-containing protein [Acetobacteraceae bacterium]
MTEEPRNESRAAAKRFSFIRLWRWLGARFVKFGSESVVPEISAISCFLILMWAGIGGALYHEYLVAEDAARLTTGNLARAFEESTRRSISQIDQILLSARAFRSALGDRFDFNEWARTQTLPDKMTAGIGMVDRNGYVFADTLPFNPAVTIADRPHFKAQLDPTRDDLYISRPVHGRVSGQDTIQFSRKLLGPHGEFAGATVLSLGCDQLSRFYETVDVGRGFVALLATDGTIMARGPLAPGYIGGSSAANRPEFSRILTERSGSLEFMGNRDSIEKIVSFRRLRDYPLIVMVGIDTDTVFHQLWSLGIRVVIGGGIITLAIDLIGVFWVQQKKRGIESRRALTITLETISQGIMMIDASGHAPVINPRAIDLLGVPQEASGKSRDYAAAKAIELAAHESEIEPRESTAVSNDAGDDEAQDSQFETARADGTVIEVRTHRLAEGGFVQTYTDVTEQRLADAKVRYLAHYDTLTGLANRVQLRQRSPAFLQQDANAQRLTAFMIVDLDGFKGVNDTLGHDVGDELLIEVARRLQTLVREEDLVARLGGDEFVILQPGLRDPSGATSLAQRVLQRLTEPVQIGSHQVRVGASIGIAYYPKDGEDADTLLKHADIALYSAKTSGRGMARVFDPEMVHAVNEYRTLEGDLRRALDDGELEVYFQPKFSGESLAIVGFEALARWHHPTRGFVSPATFIHIAEACGLIDRLGRWIAEKACATAVQWQPPLHVAVNVSLLQLRDGTLPEEIAHILERTGLRPEMLEIEVTESVMAEDNQPVLKTLNVLKNMGMSITLDDFGTGYSSLGYLRRFSFDKIKIDKSFVHGQAHDRGVRVILEAVLSMCRKLGLSIVGEGVETEQQMALLRQLGCTELQGYLLGRPMPASAVAELLRAKGHEPEKRPAEGALAKTGFELAT